MDASKEAKRRNSLNPNTKSTKYWQWGNASSMVTENGEGTAIQRLSDDTCHLGRCQLPFMTGLWEGSQAQRNQILVSEWKRHVCHTNNRRGGKDSVLGQPSIPTLYLILSLIPCDFFSPLNMATWWSQCYLGSHSSNFIEHITAPKKIPPKRE